MSSERSAYYLYLSYLCNQRCIFCASPYTNRNQPVAEIPWVTLRDKLQDENVEEMPVILSGGEPTCYSNLWALIDFLSSRRACIDIMTNGLRFAEKNFADRLLRYPVACYSVPIYGIGALHDRLVGRKSFENLLKGLDRISETNSELNIKLLITRHNYEEMPHLLKFLVGRFGTRPHYTLNTLIYGEQARNSSSWVTLSQAQEAVSGTLAAAFAHKLKLSLSFVPVCAVTERFLSERLLEFFALSRSRYSQQPGSSVRIITPLNLEFKTEQEDVFTPAVCAECDVSEICHKVHAAAEDLPQDEIGLHPVRLEQKKCGISITHTKV